MICVEVKASRDYEIRIESGSLKKAGEYIGQVVAGRHAVIVTDSTVKEFFRYSGGKSEQSEFSDRLFCDSQR